jgi:signal transduction histidine kinase
LDIDEALGEFSGDERKFKQIMLNLLSNAVKFTPDGGRVDVLAKRLNGKLEVMVRDTGIGIAPEDQAVVFEEFRQVGGDNVRKAEGTGLGLALTKRFVELHGGAIRLESTPGEGSTFTVSLPLR